MKLNNRGFAITSIIYSMLILFLALVVLIIGNLASRKAIFDKQKEDILGKFETKELLPEEFQRLEYIQSNGTQYIDTGYIGSNNTSLKIKQSFQYNSMASGVTYCAIGTADNSSARIEMGYDKATNTFWSNCGAAISRYHTSITPDFLPHEYSWDGTGYFAIDNNVAFEKNSLSATFNSSTSIYLFKDNNRLSNWCPMTLYYCKIYDNGVLVRDFIPCYRKADSVVGLYDVVEQKFYTNSGTGEFIMGELEE